jgi:hypothetical protein
MNEQSNYTQSWTFVRDFIDENSRLVVHIMAQEGLRIRYSYEIGRLNPTGKFIRYFSAFSEVTNYRVKIKRLNIQVLTMLVGQAEDWMEEECQRREDEILEQKRTREEETLVSTKSGLKTPAKTDKDKRHE